MRRRSQIFNKKIDNMNKLSPNRKFERCLFLVQGGPTIFNKKIDDMNKLAPKMRQTITRTQERGSRVRRSRRLRRSL